MARLHTRKILMPFRAALRKKSTSAEASLWNILKNKQLNNRKFRRQHSIGNYIVDFYCPSEKLIIELDGDGHGDYVQIQKDIERDKFLVNLGYFIIRFENRFVFQDPDFVKAEILSKFGRDEHLCCPHHLPPTRSRGTPPPGGGESFQKFILMK